MREFLSALLVQVEIMTVLLALCIVMEFIAVIDRYTMRQRALGIALNYLSLIGSIVAAWPLQQIWAYFGLSRRIVIPLADWLSPYGVGGAVAYIAILLAMTDFLRYWSHRAEHRWLWPFHAVHHAQTELHVANSAGHPLQVIPELLLVSIPLSLVQFTGPGVPTLISAFVVLMTMYIHSPIDIHAGPLRRLIVDNRFHRIHHSIEERHVDRNFGIGLSIWDWMFRTAYWPKPDEWPQTGVAGLEPPKSIAAFLLYPIKGMGNGLNGNNGDEFASRPSQQVCAAAAPTV
ncbi:MAG: hypothetical protein NVS3B5_05300 [Sphingomicrobium sp.]